MDTDYTRYEQLRVGGASADAAYSSALSNGRDWAYGIRMLRSVYGLDLVGARDVLIRVDQAGRTVEKVSCTRKVNR